MACERPLRAYLDSRKYPEEPRKIIFEGKEPETWIAFGAPAGVRSVELPCGHCFSCRQARAFEILVRAVAESRCYDFSSFVTLTCDDEHYNSVFRFGKLCRRPYQLFLKRLRKRIGSFRYILCGEYGARTGRAHYHLIIFGRKFVDSFVNDDYTFCASRVISECWPYGHITVDDVCSERLAYVCGYQIKIDPSKDDEDFPQFVVWSRRPGLGSKWFELYWRDMVNNGFSFNLNGKDVNINGRYFLSRLKLISPTDFDIIKAKRELVSSDDDLNFKRHDDILRHAACVQERIKQRKVTDKL